MSSPIHLAPVPLKQPTFLQGSLRPYSHVRRGGGSPPPPPPAPVAGHGCLAQCIFSWGNRSEMRVSELVRARVLRWRDLMLGGIVRMEHLEQIAYTWKMTYDTGVQDVRISAMSLPTRFPARRWTSGGRTRRGSALSCSCKHEPRRTRDKRRRSGASSAGCFDLSGIKTSIGGHYGKNCQLGAGWGTGLVANCVPCVRP